MRTLEAISRTGRFFAAHPVTRDAPALAWARWLFWQIRSRIGREVVVEWIEGQRLAVRRGMTGATGNIYTGLHEFDGMMLPLHFLRTGDLFLDVGANIGSFTVLASGVAGATTWAFEPDPDTASALLRNVELNGLADRVTIHQMALGDYDGTISFTSGQDTTNQVATSEDANVQTVLHRRLDALIGSHAPIMMKVDVEGHEDAFILGAAQTVKRESLKVIELESFSDDTLAFLTGCGFDQVSYDPISRTLVSQQIGGLNSNVIFVRDRAFVSARLRDARTISVLGKRF